MSQAPFGDMFGDIFSLLAQQGPDAWYQTATQLAQSIARSTDGDPNPAPLERQRLEELAPLVGRHLDTIFSVSLDPRVEAANRSALTAAALEQWRPLLAPGIAAPPAPSAPLDPSSEQFLTQITATLGPLFTGFQMGSVAGHFSERAWSLAVLPLPRADGTHLLAVNNLAAFADAWSLERDEVYVFALAQEFGSALILGRAGTGDALRALLLDGVRESQAAQGDLIERLQSMMGGGDLSAIVEHPERLLEGIEMPEQSDAIRAINAAAAGLLAAVNATALHVTEQVLGPRPALAEAHARHLRSDARGEEAAAALFGISLTGEHHDRAARFAQRLVADHGWSVFTPLLRVDGLPSDAELDDPAAWYERVSTSPLA